MNTKKIKLFIEGRKGLLARIKAACQNEKDIIWFHVASFGEFEEARPIIEATRECFPDRKILLTVFSPSVYEPMKDYDRVDWVFYLPLDSLRNVRRFLDAVRPSKAIFNIGEHWPNLLNELRRRKIETYIMSVRIETDSPYLKWYGFMHRKILTSCYKCVMVQNRRSRVILKGIGVPEVVVTGDARVDRVVSVASREWSDPIVDRWCGGDKVFVAGSTSLRQEIDFFVRLSNSRPNDKFMIVPHEMDEAEADYVVSSSVNGAVKYSDIESGKVDISCLDSAHILYVDKVGMLLKLYRYGFAAYVGGGFEGPMPHSVVEPASYGIPVVFGPYYERELHCKDLVANGGGLSVTSFDEFGKLYDRMKNDSAFVSKAGKTAGDYCASSCGATDEIMKIIFG